MPRYLLLWLSYHPILSLTGNSHTTTATILLCVAFAAWREHLNAGSITDWSTVAALIILIAIDRVGHQTFLVDDPSPLFFGLLAAAGWASVVLGHPFTKVHARREVDEANWQSREFHEINKHISTCWSLVFTASAVMALYADSDNAHWPLWLLATKVSVGAAIAISKTYPALYLRYLR